MTECNDAVRNLFALQPSDSLIHAASMAISQRDSALCETAQLRPFAQFGALVYIRCIDTSDCVDEWWKDLVEMGHKAGVVERVAYDPEKHGQTDAEAGDMIYWLPRREEAESLLEKP